MNKDRLAKQMSEQQDQTTSIEQKELGELKVNVNVIFPASGTTQRKDNKLLSDLTPQVI